ncbi:MAG: DNA recombination protein RmuC [Methylotenera sp.]|nr:DNA recombination protein RmuC [Methylotenera sp.]MDO9280829.1 DNA recombination protein RmuC [Methylotenera sp.]MDO9389368.1 DNA recombination protein RmuC [Methylotenera sp.]MDP1597192.1 DNA recombination protein RmuC [Methylotenera sp.]MDP1754520.1 DNA recombination protein RmuC [Methylotenera sp.]
MIQTMILVIAVAIFLLLIWQLWRENKIDKNIVILQQLEEKHRAMLLDFNDGLNKLGDRLSATSSETSERLRASVATELQATRDAMQALQLAQNNSLSLTRESVLEKLHTTLAEQGKAEQELIQSTMRNATLQLTASIEALTKSVDGRLEQIGGKVSERLDEGFKKTNQTFIDVMARLATIDEAQKKIDGLTTNVVSLQELLGDKRSRGAFGEVQLEALVRNVLPVNSFAMQYTFENGTRADCALFLPDPTGTVAVDSKFPLENYHRMLNNKLSDAEKLLAEKQFKIDVKKHVDDIATKYIISNVTSDGAVMFIPAEAVFAELHAYHADVIEYAMNKRVWVVSPTTLMAVLNTARAVLKDVETRKQVHVIKEELGKLSKDFGRFDTRMKKLADNIRQAHENAQDVHISSQKITQRFAQIERVELTKNPADLLDIIDDKED